MSVGPAALSSLLVQRLDAVLGTQLAQQGSNSATRQDAVFPPGSPEALRQELEGEAGDALAEIGGRDGSAIREASQQADLAAAVRSRFVSTDSTPSAPTSLGQTARTILTLLAQYPETAPALTGKAPLWAPAGAPAEDEESDATPRGTSGDVGGAGNSAAARSANGATATNEAVTGVNGEQGGSQDAAQDGATAQAGSQAANAASPQAANTAAARVAAIAAGSESDPAGETQNTAARTAPATAATAAGRVTGPAAAGPQPGPLAAALRMALETSGLFYESHLSDVTYGRKSAAQVADEPQAQLDSSEATPVTASPERQSILVDNARFNLPTTSSPQMAQADGQPSTGSAPTWSGSQPALAPASPPGIHPDAALLVRQQLEVLANQTVAWEGKAWPGTDMWWEISREPPERDPFAPAADAPSTWATRLVLNMPRLGQVEARLNLAGGQLVMQIVAPGGDAEIAGASNELRQRMQAAGLTLSNLTVSAHAPGLEEIEPW